MTEKQRIKHEQIRENATNKYIGKRYGRLLIIEFAYEKKNHHKYFKCLCICGKQKIVGLSHLQSNKIKSCGCLWEENKRLYRRIHGDRNCRLYSIWIGIRDRCQNPNNNAYSNYGARGIGVCKKWDNSYIAFKDWSMDNGYKDSLVIDRIDNDKGYSPDNCRWVTIKENNMNKRSTVYWDNNGTILTVKEWATRLNIKYSTLRNSLSKSGKLKSRRIDEAKQKTRS